MWQQSDLCGRHSPGRQCAHPSWSLLQFVSDSEVQALNGA